MPVASKVCLCILTMKILQHIATKNGCRDMILMNCTDREMRETVCTSLCRPVKDLPVNESAIAGKTDTAGTNTAQRERDLLQMMIFINHCAASIPKILLLK